jgi:hypothetical protein
LAPEFIQLSIMTMSVGESAGASPSGSGLPQGEAMLVVLALSLL